MTIELEKLERAFPRVRMPDSMSSRALMAYEIQLGCTTSEQNNGSSYINIGNAAFWRDTWSGIILYCGSVP